MSGEILFLSDLWLPFPGGAERYAFNLARELVRRGFDVAVLTEYAARKRFDGPPVDWRRVGVFRDRTQGAREVSSYLEDYEPSVIVTHGLFASEFRDLLAWHGIPVVQLVHNGPRLQFASFAVYSSGHTAKLGNPHTGDMVIYPPVYDDVVAETHGNAVGFIKPIPHKGADLVYQIARLCPDREFVVLRGEWQTLEILSDLPNVVFVEPVDDIRDFWAAVRVVLVPSVNEDAGTVAQEAALNGVPCLSSNVGGLIETNGGGIILDTRDPMSWAVHLEAVLNDRDVYDAVAQRQRDYVAGWKQTELIDAFAYKIAALREGVKA